MTPNEIAEVQHFLNSQGAGLKVDGVMGPNTMHMLERFQQAAGLRPDGIVGRQTQGAINQTQQMPIPQPRPDMMPPIPRPNPMVAAQGQPQQPSPPMGDPDRNITDPRDPNFGRMIQAQLLAQQSNADRNSLSNGMPPSFGTGAQLPPQPPSDGSSMATANSGWAGGPMPSIPPGMAQQPNPAQQMDAKQRLSAALLGR